ncbi:MAG: hypothetical protein IT257_12720 [Chitinophagaceae bacterium]|nr:hypothetical protein [Chitinophagaceae bacterium]
MAMVIVAILMAALSCSAAFSPTIKISNRVT